MYSITYFSHAVKNKLRLRKMFTQSADHLMAIFNLQKM
jgi:hypothetical protein